MVAMLSPPSAMAGGARLSQVPDRPSPTSARRSILLWGSYGLGMRWNYMLNPAHLHDPVHKFAMNSVPGIPFAFWAAFFALLFTGLNLFGIRTSARINEGLAAGWGL